MTSKFTTGNEKPKEFILPASRELRNAVDVVYYFFEPRSDGRSALVKAFSGKNSEVATSEVGQLGDGNYRITCTREGKYITIDFVVTRNPLMLEGHIDGQQFRIDGYGTATIKVALTDAQRHIMQAWNGAHDSFIGLGEALTIRSDAGCVLTALGVGVGGVACCDGVLAGCAGALFGLAYLADHCMAPPVEM